MCLNTILNVEYMPHIGLQVSTIWNWTGVYTITLSFVRLNDLTASAVEKGPFEFGK